MKILGIDPSLSSTGWGVIESQDNKLLYIDSGIIKTHSKQSICFRLSHIANSIEQNILIHRPDMISMEETFVNSNFASSLKLAYARGAIISIIGNSKIPFYEYAPNKIKKSIVGAGHATKEQVLHMIKLILSNFDSTITLDESDAIAIAYTCFVNYKILD